MGWLVMRWWKIRSSFEKMQGLKELEMSYVECFDEI